MTKRLAEQSTEKLRADIEGVNDTSLLSDDIVDLLGSPSSSSSSASTSLEETLSQQARLEKLAERIEFLQKLKHECPLNLQVARDLTKAEAALLKAQFPMTKQAAALAESMPMFTRPCSMNDKPQETAAFKESPKVR